MFQASFSVSISGVLLPVLFLLMLNAAKLRRKLWLHADIVFNTWRSRTVRLRKRRAESALKKKTQRLMASLVQRPLRHLDKRNLETWSRRCQNEKTVFEIPMVSATSTLQLMSTGSRSQVESINGLVPDTASDASDLSRHLKENGDC